MEDLVNRDGDDDAWVEHSGPAEPEVTREEMKALAEAANHAMAKGRKAETERLGARYNTLLLALKKTAPALIFKDGTGF